MFRSLKIRTRRVFEGYIVDATGVAMLVGAVGILELSKPVGLR